MTLFSLSYLSIIWNISLFYEALKYFYFSSYHFQHEFRRKNNIIKIFLILFLEFTDDTIV